MKYYFSLLCLLSALFCSGDELPEEYHSLARQKYGFTIEEKARRINGIVFDKLNSQQMLKQWRRLFGILEKYEEVDFKKFKLKQIAIIEDIDRKRSNNHSGYRQGKNIYMVADFKERTFFHELYHTVDIDYKNAEWEKLNPPGFTYTENAIEKDRKTKSFDIHFTREYAQTHVREDKADTFGHMMAEGKAFLKRCERSKIMERKMHMIVEELSERNIIAKSFWTKHLGIEFKD